MIRTERSLCVIGGHDQDAVSGNKKRKITPGGVCIIRRLFIPRIGRRNSEHETATPHATLQGIHTPTGALKVYGNGLPLSLDLSTVALEIFPEMSFVVRTCKKCQTFKQRFGDSLMVGFRLLLVKSPMYAFDSPQFFLRSRAAAGRRSVRAPIASTGTLGGL